MSYKQGQMRRALTSVLGTSLLPLAALALAGLAVACGTGTEDPAVQPGQEAGSGSSTNAGGSGNTNTSGGSTSQPNGGSGNPSGGTGATTQMGTTLGSSFSLRAEFTGPCAKANAIDINLGNSPDNFVRAAYCQVNGTEPDDAAKALATQLTSTSYTRRIDVAQTFCNQANRNCTWAFSDPWTTQMDLTTPCTRSGTRDLGAVLMFFNQCPNGTNCSLTWSNTHAEGMFSQSPLLSFGSTATGIYGPNNPGFWRRELLDAAYAGVQFFLLNTYGPDLSAAVDPLAQLTKALDDTGGVVKIGMFDDTSTWGHASGAFSTAPDMSNSSAAAQSIYQAKWKPFFSRVPQKYWYLFNGRPVIYFYNSGTLKPPDHSAGTISALSGLFEADFGVKPFLAVDDGYYDSAMNGVSDARFKWDTFQCGGAGANGSCVANKQLSESNLNGVKLDHFMVKWDSLGRDQAGHIATSSDLLVKDDSLLKQRLADSASAQLAVIATWNDMGEGTSINRNYDYYVGGQWLEPDVFLKDLRAAQCSN